MDDYSSPVVSLSPSSGYGAESVFGEDLDYESDQHAYQHHDVLPDSDLSEAESEGGLFVEAERSVSPASVITLSASEHEGDRSPVSQQFRGPDREQDPYLNIDEHAFDLQSELERELARSDIDLISSDSEGTVGQQPGDSPDPLHPDPLHFAGHQYPIHLGGRSEASDEEDYDFDSDDLFGDGFEESEEEDYDEDEDVDDANFLGLPEPVPHHHHHLHHHHFHHPRLPAIHPDRLSPIVLGVNPLQHLGPHFNVNFLPPHLHEHIGRSSSSPAHPASPRGLPRMDELVGVELGAQGGPGAGRNLRGRVAQNQQQRAQSNVIDLTLDDEEVEVVGSQNARRQQSQRRNNAPRLNRSDGSYVGNENVIELSSDSEDEVQVSRVNAAVPPANHHRHHHHHIHHHHQHVPHHHHRGLMDRRSPRRMPGNNNDRAEDNNRGLFNMVGNVFGHIMGMSNRGRDDGEVVMIGSSPAAILPIPNMPNLPNLPIHLDYVAHPFHHPRPPPGPHKPPHQAPPKPREGYTRDTNEDEVIICPSCDEELAYDPDEGDENGPPLKKARTKKDKAEHHFWAVKECGHVFCKRCYENRKPTVKNPVKVGFQISPQNPKKIVCAVDGCDSDVSSKTAWVGLFL
ncbi:hypothetical protein SCAR479_11571 [Seiridium cardinale]|uniref:Cell cycle control protein n=1 Tax=Seiridium cardinale TaxID=138064 RepID=A0ABR2XDA2_9PEZI